MTVAEQSIPVVPDAVEAVEGWRRWNFEGGKLCSLNCGHKWEPGEQMTAACDGAASSYSWKFARNGMSLGDAEKTVESLREMSRLSYSLHFGGRFMPPPRRSSPPSVPHVEPPEGMGYALVETKHDAPDEGCTCGIYAATDLSICPPGEVSGKVKLWGKVVPGERGWRAQYAYPSEFHVPARLANHPALLAYGVPIVKTTPMTAALAALALPSASSSRWLPSHGRFVYFGVIGINLAAGAYNVVAAVLR